MIGTYLRVADDVCLIQRLSKAIILYKTIVLANQCPNLALCHFEEKTIGAFQEIHVHRLAAPRGGKKILKPCHGAMLDQN